MQSCQEVALLAMTGLQHAACIQLIYRQHTSSTSPSMEGGQCKGALTSECQLQELHVLVKAMFLYSFWNCRYASFYLTPPPSQKETDSAVSQENTHFQRLFSFKSSFNNCNSSQDYKLNAWNKDNSSNDVYMYKEKRLVEMPCPHQDEQSPNNSIV